MKRFLISGITLVACLVMFAACGDDDDPIEQVTEQLIGSMDADIDGTAWSADAPGAVRSNGATVITGVTTDQTRTIILTANGTTQGNYDFTIASPSGGALVRIVTNNDTTQYVPVSGNFEITSLSTSNNRLSGTFSFDAFSLSVPIDTVSITNGTFNNVLFTDQ
ncbi:MAG: DUF6252 family protein [Salibacteraceae bacterium]